MKENIVIYIAQPGGGCTHTGRNGLLHVEHDGKYLVCAKIPVVGVVFLPFAHEETHAQRVQLMKQENTCGKRRSWATNAAVSLHDL